MYAQPAKKLLFMGGEFGQRREWAHDDSLEWHLLAHTPHRGLKSLMAELNGLYQREAALHDDDLNPAGFEWIDCNDNEASVLSFVRQSRSIGEVVMVVCNFTPVPRSNYRVGSPRGGVWREILNTDATDYGGSGWGNLGGIEAAPIPFHGRPHSLSITLPPLAVVYLKSEADDR